MQTSNPALRPFDSVASVSDQTMTLNGTIWKCVLSVAILFAGAFWSWRVIPAGGGGLWLLVGSVGAFVLAMITSFKPQTAPITTPLYAALEGLLLGTISSFFDARYPGIAIHAVIYTALTTVVMLAAYLTRLIRPTEKFRAFVVIATLSICGIYFIDFILGLFGRGMPISYSNGTFGLIFSGVVVGIAALNLILDFGIIEEGSQNNLPKYMEWYGAFALMVTLVWLYLEILRLLLKLQSRRN